MYYVDNKLSKMTILTVMKSLLFVVIFLDTLIFVIQSMAQSLFR